LDKNPAALVGVWGLAYKENTHSVKNSPSLATIAQLKSAKLQTHDPVVPSATAKEPLEAARGADALMILTPWPQYRAIAPAEIAKTMKGRIVLDPYGVLDRDAARTAGLTVYALGRAPDA
jgi:UDPglucose 6-dehydrogenase